MRIRRSCRKALSGSAVTVCRFVAGIAAKKGQRALAVRLLPATKEVVFGLRRGLTEVMYAGTGFPSHAPGGLRSDSAHANCRSATSGLANSWCRISCRWQCGKTIHPLAAIRPFDKLMTLRGQGVRKPVRERTRIWGTTFPSATALARAGYKIYADTTIRLGHIGPYAFSWEEAGGSNQHFGGYIYRVLDAAGNSEAS